MQVEIFPRSVLVEREGLAARAQEVLGQNDMGGWTRAATDLYPHQWRNGKVPHIVFNPEARRTATSPALSTGPAPQPLPKPLPPYTSCLCQPPTHAIAAQRVWKPPPTGGLARKLLPSCATSTLSSWHRYLLV